MDINKIDLQSENRRLVETLADTDLVGAQIPETGELVAIEKSKLVTGGGGGGGDSLDAIYECVIDGSSSSFDRVYGAQYDFTYESLNNSITGIRNTSSNDRAYPVVLRLTSPINGGIVHSVGISNNATFEVYVESGMSLECILLIFKKPMI